LELDGLNNLELSITDLPLLISGLVIPVIPLALAFFPLKLANPSLAPFAGSDALSHSRR